ncbi:acyltransferase family protein [Phenylobacterium sp. LjRoot225]|uniref:acyltransferase family protein n=1 Tax=Phenylobacterium sp. LjRoot225 TaxID=3342285 RepID=UPI003ECE4ADF
MDRQLSSAAGYRSDVQGLRALAVLLVVVFHADPRWIPGGFVGVDVFFVISGYLITRLIVREVEAKGRLDFRAFYARRAARLLPASLLVLLSVMIASLLLLSPSEQKDTAKAGLATAAYLSNFHFIREAQDYFAASSANNPLLHTWSLAVEEQFYLVWPLLIVAGLRLFGARRLPVVLGVAGAASFGLCLLLMREHQTWAFFASPPRAWEFAVGGIAGFASPSRSVWVGRFASWLGFAGIAGSAVLLTEAAPFPGVLALPATLGTAAILLAEGQGLGAISKAPGVQWLGNVSYSWYLWHWPVFVFARLAGAPETALVLAGLILLSLALASLTYWLVENPARRLAWVRSRPGRTVVAGLGVSVMAAGCTVGTYAASEVSANSPAQRRITRAVEARAVASRPECNPAPDDATVKTCVFGDPRGARTLVLFGDSHANMWSTSVDAAARRNGWKLVTFLKPSCPAATIPATYYVKLKRPLRECVAWRAEAIRRIIALRPDAVVIASAEFYLRPTQAGAVPVPVAQWRAGLQKTVQSFDAAGIEAILVRDVPAPGYDVPTCLSRAVTRGLADAACPVDAERAINADAVRAEADAVQAARHATRLDLTDQFCTEGRCDVVRRGIVMYRDDNHMSATYAQAIEPAMEARLKALMN